ncbi:hypothetical protein VIGAN_06213300 [Vigna angularis var. angularis]|uniref:Secreted protein n=1 Tax=Vigna angularis var. angularis TaxID=157739 RepID=A0A0S3SDC1_PHAAN|nr:hypothetical protein VIGAN_06213300 [Vigna angularis var. angularis]
MLQYLLVLFVVAVVADVVDAEVVVVAEIVVAAAEVDAAAAASGIEFEVVETFVQPKECTWRDYWDRIVAHHQMKQSVLHLKWLVQSLISNAEFLLLMHHLML